MVVLYNKVYMFMKLMHRKNAENYNGKKVIILPSIVIKWKK